MPNALGNIGNAAESALGGGVVGMGLNLLGNIFGLNKGPQEDPITRQSRQLALQAQQQNMNFARSAPMSDPLELAGLSQDRGSLGAAQRQQQQSVFGQYNPQMGAGNLADMMRNITNSQIGQQMSLQESHLFNALSARRQALQEAANTGGRVAGPTYQPTSDLPAMLGSIAHSIAYNRNRNQSGGGGASTTGVPSTTGVGPAPGVILGGNGQPGYTPQMPGNFPQPQGGAAGTPDQAGVNAITGGLPPQLFMQPQPAGDQQASIQGIPQPSNAANQYNLSGLAGLANQQRQSFLRFG